MLHKSQSSVFLNQFILLGIGLQKKKKKKKSNEFDNGQPILNRINIIYFTSDTQVHVLPESYFWFSSTFNIL